MNSLSNGGNELEKAVRSTADQVEVESRDHQPLLQEQREEDVGVGNGSHMFVFTNEKAGMKQMKSEEKERANRIIYEMSKNSSYFKQAEMQDKKVDAKVSKFTI